MSKVYTMEEALDLIKSGDCIAVSGIVMSGVAEEILTSLEERFLKTGAPNQLTGIFSAGQGNWKDGGWEHLAHEGLLRRIIGGHYGTCARLGELITANRVEAYNLPQGVILNMFRNACRGIPGELTKIGIKTFVDPVNGGGKLNSVTHEDLVLRKRLDGEDWLYYKTPKVNVAIIRGTTADENGNVTLDEEILPLDMRTVALAARACGGKVIVQVKNLAQAGTLLSDRVSIPGSLVDAVVLSQEPERYHRQTHGQYYSPSMSGHINVPLSTIKPLPLDEKKVISRRAAMELKKGFVVNLGIGTPEGVSNVAAEEGFSDQIILTSESGVVGGVPVGGTSFGAVQNAWGVMDAMTQFDFYHGGGLDITYLGLAQVNEKGDVNVSKFGSKVTGCGGFINISQNTGKLVYCGAFTAGGLKTRVADGRLTILQEGRDKKFSRTLEQVTYSGEYGAETGQEVLYITERAVFRLTAEGLLLIEIAPGVELERDVLGQMEFTPKVAPDLKLMDEKLFLPALMGMKHTIVTE
ncbi:Caffeate CoA-transferase [bioreactor metagenome]|uniref:Caffeate CoA-transferase n=1 Tax=bioreactor metagenome TaxID=1076179 RepID=A0A644WCU0_9ZZZZ